MEKVKNFLAVILFCSVWTFVGIKTFGMSENSMKSGQLFISGTEGTLKTEFFGKLSEEREQTKQKALYAFSIEELERMLSDNCRREQEGGRYMESVGSIYLFPKTYSGALVACYENDETTSFRMVMTEDDTEQRQEYECRRLQDGSFWFVCRMESGSNRDLPDYTVNEVLRYGRADYVYDDGERNLEEERQNREGELERYMEAETGGAIQEFWCREGRLCLVDRETERFLDVTDEKESCIADFLAGQLERIDCGILVNEGSFAEIEKYKPEGYSLLWEKNGWNDIAVCDLNHDGRMDYVAALYPEDYEEVSRYADGSLYEKLPQYYAAGFWLLLSGEDDSYQQIQLSDSIEYWETELSLTKVAFVEAGILELEYFVGRSPFDNAVLRFAYDEETEDFYIIRSDYRDGFDDSLLTGDVDNYGQTTLRTYFTGQQRYCEGVWDSRENIPLPGENVLGYFSDSFQYRCMNPTEESNINSLIQEKEYEILRTLVEAYPSGGLDVSMLASPVFYNAVLVSGRIEIYFYDEEDEFIRIQIPVMVDKQSGSYVMVTKLAEQETFLRILEEWTEDALSENIITPEDKMRCIKAVEENWEKETLTETYFKKEGCTLSLQIAEEGVRVSIREKTDGWQEYDYTIDKEYFIGTEIWKYYNQ